MTKYLSQPIKHEDDTGFRMTIEHKIYDAVHYYKGHYIQFIFRFPFPFDCICNKDFVDKCTENIDYIIDNKIGEHKFEFNGYHFYMHTGILIETNKNIVHISAPRDDTIECLKTKGLWNKEKLEEIEKYYRISKDKRK